MAKVSDALPIKLWLAGEPVFNDQEHPGVGNHLFVQKYPADKPLTIQLTDEAIKGYVVKIIESPTQVHYVPMVRELKGDQWVYHAEFTFQSLGITNKCVQIQIVDIFYEVSGALNDDDDQISGSILNTLIVFNVSGTLTDDNDSIGGVMTWNNFNSAFFGLNPSPCVYSFELFWQADQQWGTGVVMYWDAGLTIPVTGYNTIVPSWSGEHFNLSPTGVVGTSKNIYC
jgi:hypothetical protein